MRYVIAGKKETFNKYCKNNGLKDESLYISGGIVKELYSRLISKDDIIVLLHGWFAKSWAKKFIEDVKIIYPTIKFEYHDGKIGESERKNLKSDSVLSRFDLLDL